MACTCNVGDSLAYVYSPSEGHVREITQGSHDIQSNRDMRDALGKSFIFTRKSLCAAKSTNDFVVVVVGESFTIIGPATRG